MLLVLISLLKKLYGSKINESIQILSITCHVVSIIVLILDLSHIILSYTEGISSLSGEWIYKYPVMSLADAFYFVESLSLYTLMYVIAHIHAHLHTLQLQCLQIILYISRYHLCAI